MVFIKHVESWYLINIPLPVKPWRLLIYIAGGLKGSQWTPWARLKPAIRTDLSPSPHYVVDIITNKTKTIETGYSGIDRGYTHWFSPDFFIFWEDSWQNFTMSSGVGSYMLATRKRWDLLKLSRELQKFCESSSSYFFLVINYASKIRLD